VLAGLQSGLEQRGDFEIVIAGDSLHAVEDDDFAQARVCIVDLPTGAEAQPMVAMANQSAALVLLSSDQDGPVADWLAAGLSVLPRDASIELIGLAAHAAAAGLVSSTRQLTADALRVDPRADRRRQSGATEPLTAREHEVLLKMSLGLGNRQIAQALHISAHTAKFHVAQIIAKLDATSRAHAVAKALRSGLVEI
jgi:DNA-binding NarL/FixJ family response regulator